MNGGSDLFNYEVNNLNWHNENTFHHVALIKSGGNLLLAIDGIIRKTIVDNNDWSSSSSLGVGGHPVKDPGNEYITVYIDEFRISKGIARWTANFQPPTAPYTDASPTDPFLSNYLFQVGSSVQQVFSETNPISIVLDNEEFTSQPYSLISTTPSGVEINEPGIYEISYSVSYMSNDIGNDARRNARTFVYKNNDPVNNRIQSSVAYGYARGDTNSSDAPVTSSGTSFFVQLNTGDTVHLSAEAVGDWVNGDAVTIANESWLKILKIE